MDRVPRLTVPGWGDIVRGPRRDELLRALRGARACWPVAEAERAEWADAFGVAMPAPRAGETLLVSVSPEVGRVALWLTTEEDHERGTVPLVGTAATTARSMLHLTMRDHPLPAPEQLQRALRAPPTFRALRVQKSGPGLDHRLDGTSFGLALGLAAASWLADVPLPAHIVALATLDEGGRTGPVDALTEKIGAILDFAPGVTTLLVAGCQLDDAHGVLASRGPDRGLEVRAEACPSFGLALDRFLPLDRSTLAALPRDEAGAAVRRLFSIAVLGTPHALSWSGVADALAGLTDGPPGRLDDESARRGSFGRAVALRHAGRQVGPVQCDEDWILGLPRPFRLKVAAHLVQDASDGAFELLPARIRFAHALLAPLSERHDDDLRLLGALGRAEAALHRWDSATESLREAVAGWEVLDQLPEASFPLCELLRVLGIRRDAEAVGRLCDGEVTRLLADPRTDPMSAAFVLQARGRAEVQVGAPRAALETLASGAVSWERQDRHLRSAQLRWRARALQALGEEPEARTAREAAQEVARGEPGHGEFVLIVDLDAALAEGGDGAEVVAALAAGGRSAAEMRRLTALGCVEGQTIAEVWRY